MRNPSVCRRALLRCLYALAALVFCATARLDAQSQSATAARGAVVDSTGTPVVAASVELHYEPTGAVVAVLTDSLGRYHAADLRPGGPYRIRVSALGFAPSDRTGVHLRLGETRRLDFRLSTVPIVLAAVEARAQADRSFSTSRTGPAIHIDAKTVEAYPTVERNFLELAQLSPMVRASEEGGLSISGQNERFNSVVVDGAILQDVFGASGSGLPGAGARGKAIPMEAVQEFQVQVAPFDARSGGFTGGMMSAVTKSGSNVWQGSAFGLFRDERLFGALDVDGVDVAPDDYRKDIYGFTLGGPLRRDRTHMFVAAEVERRREPTSGIHVGLHDPVYAAVAPDSLARFAGILSQTFGFEPGPLGRYTLENPLTNVFARVDHRLSDEKNLVLRYNYAGAERDIGPNRAAVGAYELGSTGYRVGSATHAVTARLLAHGRGGRSSELMLNYQRTRDRTDPAGRFPQMDVELFSSVRPGTGYVRRMIRAGAGYFVQQNDLDQDVLQLSAARTFAGGAKVTTFGAGADLFRFRHRFLPGALGHYFFFHFQDLEANLPHRYQVSALLPGADPEVAFSVLQPHLYFQREWNSEAGLVLHFGARLESPVYLDSPGRNEAVEEPFGLRTDALPGGAVFLSPRFGFNWQNDRPLRTQVRGGAGAFVGRLPYVWFANAFAYNGLRSALLTCENVILPSGDTIRIAPPVSPGGPAPTQCLDGTGPDPLKNAMVVAFDPEFRYPKEAKVSLALDQALPLGFVASMEGLAVVTLDNVFIEDRNLPPPVDNPSPQRGYTDGFGDREHYGTPSSTGYTPGRKDPRFAHVLAMTNGDATAEAFALTFELGRGFGDRLDLRAAYSYTRSNDNQSLVAVDAFANFGSTAIEFSPNNPSRAPSAFDRPHKVVASARGRLPRILGAGELSLVYVGQSGDPYSYVYGSDVNGDGYNGVGVPLDASNDLLYVPDDVNRMPATVATKMIMRDLIDLDPCLAEARGTIVGRNACRTPWTNRLDARVRQEVRFRGSRIEVTGDLVNVLNLFNSEWGRVWEVPAMVPVLDILRRIDDEDVTSDLETTYSGPLRQGANAAFGPALPYTVVAPASQWQAQLGVRVAF